MLAEPIRRALLLLVLASAACAAPATSDESEDDVAAGSEDALTSRPPSHHAYGAAPGWTATCDGAPMTQADLAALLGSRSQRTLGRFTVAVRDFCNPWVNGTSSCGPSGESREAYTGDATFAFGLDPNGARYTTWQFDRGPLLVHETGSVVARRIGQHVVLQLVGDVSAVDIGTAVDSDHTVTGTLRLRGRLMSSDLMRDEGSLVRGYLGLVVGEGTQRIDAASIDPDGLRPTTPMEPAMPLGLSKMQLGHESWSSRSWTLQGSITPSCMRLSDGMAPNGVVVTSVLTAK